MPTFVVNPFQFLPNSIEILTLYVALPLYLVLEKVVSHSYYILYGFSTNYYNDSTCSILPFLNLLSMLNGSQIHVSSQKRTFNIK